MSFRLQNLLSNVSEIHRVVVRIFISEKKTELFSRVCLERGSRTNTVTNTIIDSFSVSPETTTLAFATFRRQIAKSDISRLISPSSPQPNLIAGNNLGA